MLLTVLSFWSYSTLRQLSQIGTIDDYCSGIVLQSPSRISQFRNEIMLLNRPKNCGKTVAAEDHGFHQPLRG